MDSPARSLVVKVTSGVEAPERLSQAFTVAATAVASGVEVSLWLTGDATWMGVPGRAESVELAHAAPLAELRGATSPRPPSCRAWRSVARRRSWRRSPRPGPRPSSTDAGRADKPTEPVC